MKLTMMVAASALLMAGACAQHEPKIVPDYCYTMYVDGGKYTEPYVVNCPPVRPEPRPAAIVPDGKDDKPKSEPPEREREPEGEPEGEPEREREPEEGGEEC